jgi:phosphatidylserine/phosphatidylglycerophosphate/cardiolipin synthase-like enzyme
MVVELQKLHDAVEVEFKDRISQGILYGYSNTNYIGGYSPKDGYLWDTPHGNWTGSPSVERGHSDAFAKAIEELIGSAESFVDITTMKAPSGKFLDALVNGFRKIATAEKTVSVRLLIGIPARYEEQLREAAERRQDHVELRMAPGPDEIDEHHLGAPDWWKWLNENIGSQLVGFAGYLTIDLGVYQYWTTQGYPEGRNHSKIIAVDGKRMITGGHNLWGDDYLGTSPIFDLSMRFDGPVAIGGHNFADKLWDFVRQYNRTIHTYSHRLRPDLSIHNDIPAFSPMFQATQPGQLKAMWVGGPGRGLFRDSRRKEILQSPMQMAFVKALRTASHCRIAQQSLGSFSLSLTSPPERYSIMSSQYLADNMIFYWMDDKFKAHYYNLTLIDALAEFLMRNDRESVLDIMMSPPDGGSYSNGEAPGAIFDLLAYRMRPYPPYRYYSKQDFVISFNNKVRLIWPAITNLSSGEAVRFWGVNNKPMATHAKFWMLDNRLFYVGSENFYASIASWAGGIITGGLQEFGVITEADETVAKMVFEQYFGLAMKYGFRRKCEIGDLLF